MRNHFTSFRANSVLKFYPELDRGVLWCTDGESFLINLDGMEIVKQCLTEKSAAEVIEHFKRKTNTPRNTEERMLNFLKTLTDKGIVNYVHDINERSLPTLIMTDVVPSPDVLILEATQRCNLKCIHCYIGTNDLKGSELSFEEIVKVMDESSRLGVFQLFITGGEPLVRPDILEILEHGLKKFQVIYICTNGTNIDESLASYLGKNRDKMCVHLSIDSFRPSVHDKFRGVPGAFERMVSAVERLLRYEVKIRANITVSKLNYQEIDHLVDFVNHQMQIRSIGFMNVVGVGRALEHPYLLVPEEILAKIWCQYWDFIYSPSETCVETSLSFYGTPCGLCERTVCVNAFGNVTICPFASNDPFFHVGNVRNKSLIGIWKSSPLLNSLRNKNCRFLNVCGFAKVCRGGCRMRAFYTTGDLTAPDTLTCRVMKLKFEGKMLHKPLNDMMVGF